MKTLLLTFDDGGDSASRKPGTPLRGAYQKLHAPRKENQVQPSLITRFVGWFAGNDQMAAHQQWDDDKIYDAGPGALPVGHDGTSTFSFLSPSYDESARRAVEHAQGLTQQYLGLRKNQAYAQDFPSISEAADELFADLRASGEMSSYRAPDPSKYVGGKDNPGYRFAAAMYELGQ